MPDSHRARRRKSLRSRRAGSGRAATSPPGLRRLGFESLEARQMLAVLTVDSYLDVTDAGDGVTTLREAIATANATPGADEIEFSAALPSGDIVLQQGEFQITETLTIRGPGSLMMSIDAHSASRIFHFTSTAGNLTVSGMTLSRGRTHVTNTGPTDTIANGGAIRFAAGPGNLLTLDDVRVTGSMTTSQYAHGAGVYAAGDVLVANNFIGGASSNNLNFNRTIGQFANGAGLYAVGNATLVNSIFRGNVVGSSSSNYGVYIGGNVSLLHTTITMTGAIGAIGVGGSATIANSIITDQLGVIGPLVVTYSLISDNTATGLMESPVGSPDIHGNLIGGSTNGIIDPKFHGTGGFRPAIGLMSRWQPGIALAADSPAIDAGDPSFDPFATPIAIEHDQRGFLFARVVDGDGDGVPRVDMGAIESQGLTLVVSSLAEVENDGNYAPGALTLREAFEIAGTTWENDVVNFDVPELNAGLPQTLVTTLGPLTSLNGDQPFISPGGLAINGPGPALLTLDAASQPGLLVFHYNEDSDITIRGLTLTHSTDSAIHSSSIGLLVLDDVIVIDNHFGDLSTNGGGVYHEGDVLVRNSRIERNSSQNQRGGGIYAGGDVTVEHSHFLSNIADGHGGAIHALGSVMLHDSEVSNNSAVDSGGGVSSFGSVHIVDSSLTHNTVNVPNRTISGSGGGGVSAAGVFAVDSVISFNRVLSDFNDTSLFGGGGVSSGAGDVVLLRTTVSNNAILTTFLPSDPLSLYFYYGGGVRATNVEVIDSVIENNQVGDFAPDFWLQKLFVSGGGVYASDSAIVRNSRINSNSVSGGGSGGGVYTGAASIYDSEFVSNSAAGRGGRGGALFAFPSATIERSLFRLNTTNGNTEVGSAGFGLAAGGAIYVTEFVEEDEDTVPGSLTIRDSVIEQNRTLGRASPGGGIFVKGNADIVNSTIRENSTLGDSETVIVPPLTIYTNASTGGGIAVHGDLNITDSTLANNSTARNIAHGGALFATGDVSISRTTISGNHTSGAGAQGGGMLVEGDLTIADSLLTQNTTAGAGAHIGAAGAYGDLTLINSTVAANGALGPQSVAGGVVNDGTLRIFSSTITANSANDTGLGSPGGGGVRKSGGTVIIQNSIIAGNTTSSGTAADIRLASAVPDIDYTLVGHTGGSGITPATGIGNVLNVGAALIPLADNGGPTQTYALSSGSPALNAGNPALVAGAGGAPHYDQRGFAFSRVVGGRIDMGAVERGAVSANFDFDDDVDGADFLIWQRGFGTIAPNGRNSTGDADIDSDVDAADLAIWRSQFGTMAPSTVAAVEANLVAPSSSDALDAVYAAENFALSPTTRPEFRPLGSRRLRFAR